MSRSIAARKRPERPPPFLTMRQAAKWLSRRSGSKVEAKDVRNVLVPVGAAEKVGKLYRTDEETLWRLCPMMARLLYASESMGGRTVEHG